MKSLSYAALIANLPYVPTTSAHLYEDADCKDDYRSCLNLTSNENTICVKMPVGKSQSKPCEDGEKKKSVFFNNLTGKTVVLNLHDEDGYGSTVKTTIKSKVSKKVYSCLG